MQHKGNLASIAASGVCSALVEDLSKLHATMRSFPPHFTRNHHPKCNEVEASYQKTSVLQEETRKKDRRTADLNPIFFCNAGSGFHYAWFESKLHFQPMRPTIKTPKYNEINIYRFIGSSITQLKELTSTRICFPSNNQQSQVLIIHSVLAICSCFSLGAADLS